MHLNGLDLLFWVASFLGHVVLLCVLWIRRRIRMFPLFTCLITANIIRSIVLYAVLSYGTKATYFYTYQLLIALDVALQLGVVYEMASYIFRPLGVWPKDVRSGLVWLIVGSTAIAAGLTWLANPVTRLSVQTVVIRGYFFSAVLMSELFVGLIVLSVTAGLPWKTHVARIAQGLGVYSVIDVMIETGHSYFGLGNNTRAYTDLSHIRIAVYLCCLSYWIIMLWREAPQPRELTEQMRRQLIALQEKMQFDLHNLRSGRRY